MKIRIEDENLNVAELDVEVATSHGLNLLVFGNPERETLKRCGFRLDKILTRYWKWRANGVGFYGGEFFCIHDDDKGDLPFALAWADETHPAHVPRLRGDMR